ncbi:hypothetical protein [Actinomadura chokoriensis]|uniref:Uncharacterized protein n=1 Tax=Actinomadura chokoriensis TaxID=454156 RepID=A0ABV4QS70_9ACTN
MHETKRHGRTVEGAPPAGGYERYVGGSPEAERVHFEKLARDVMRVQSKIKKRAGAARIERAFHAKATLGVETDPVPGARLGRAERNGMTSVILRHCPELAAVLPRDTSAFAPWRRTAVAS